ncbi:iron-sulfur cluster assembly protein 1-like, partial [Trifolium pratense]
LDLNKGTVLVIKVLAAKQLLLLLTSIGPKTFFQIPLAVVNIFKDMFVYMGMYNEDVGKQVSAHFDISRNNSKVYAFGSINNLATVVVAKIEGTTYELVKFDANATNNLVPIEFYYCHEIAKHLSLPPVKLHCSMLAEDAIKAAVKDYLAKRGSATAAGTGEKSATA